MPLNADKPDSARPSSEAARPSLEIHIPISPTPKFLRMARCLVASLRHFGGEYSQTPVILTIGDTTLADDRVRRDNPWLDAWKVDTRWVPLDLFARESYYATANERFTYEFKSDMVLMLDADMLVARPFDDLVSELHVEQKTGGVIAYASPFQDASKWQRLFDLCGLGLVKPIHEHPGWPYLYPERARYCPPYFNLGFLLMPRQHASAIGRVIYDSMHKAANIEETIYKCQLAFGLAVTSLDLPYECLPLRYNFANNRDLEALHGAEQAYACILHLIWNHQGVWKESLYGEPDGIQKLLERDDLAGINKQAQEVLRHIWPDIQ
ncbi:MAG: hypothetical protein QOJ65_1084 [Fimbriimonadaceae bacterium]|jgi:hypothetical protein|nr:hypothetical protein [Fimbriimonadaceae bacterium]